MTDIESSKTVRELVKEKSVTMEYFLETSHLDAATADMLKKYDRDGNGSFSKDEVVAIILDLREAMQSNEALGASNKFLKKIIVAVVGICVLMLASIFGLSYGVAALTAKLDVDNNGIMTTTDGNTVVATDSVTSYKIAPSKDETTGTFCLMPSEAEGLFNRISGGSGALVEFDGVNDTHTVVENLVAGSLDMADGRVCFMDTSGQQVCMEPSPECTNGRRRMEECNDDTAEDLWAALSPIQQFLWGTCYAGCGGDAECICGCMGMDYAIKIGG